MSDRNNGAVWILRLICCGREDGVQVFTDWNEADAFRESYCDADGHDRQGIIE